MAFAFKSNYPQIARESGFKFHQPKDGPLDWRLVGSMEVDRILREQQFEHIDAVLFHLAEAPLASMLDSNVLDSGVAKYFTLSQLSLQYMIFCRKFLDESVRTLRENIIKLETQNIHLRTINQEHTDNILHLHKKLSQVEAIHEIIFPCHVCTKNFVSNDALNIHLSKKHLKSPTIEIQGKEKDQKLINTIKLELEIKQLKERLNIAEKDIRQTSEMKKVSPSEVIKLNSSTQTEIETQNAGTQMNFDKTRKGDSSATKDFSNQCNLFEIKELDCTEDVKNYIILNDIKESKCNVKYVEDNKADILFDIQEKISKFEALQKTYANDNQQSMNEIKLQLDEFLENQTKQYAEEDGKKAILSNTPYQILPATSLDELNRTLSNMFFEVSQINLESTNRIITKIEKNYEQKLFQLEIKNEKKKKVQPLRKMQSLGSQFSLNKVDSIEKIDAPKNKLSSLNLSQNTNTINETSKCTSSDARSDSYSSTSVVEFHNSLNLRKDKGSDKASDSQVFQKLENKLALYGLNTNSKSISVTEAAKISGHLLEQRCTFKEVYPTFYETRNKLNKLVEYFISQRNNKEFDRAKQKIKLPLQIDQNIVSKKHIERILRSPIKKPTSYVLSYNKDDIKPVPMPRKHVMFHTENEENTDGKFSLRSKSLARNKK